MDIIQEAQKYNGRILLHDEDNTGAILPSWELLDRVLTPKEAVSRFATQGYHFVKFYRVPITDEQTPEVADFDDLVYVLRSTSPDTHVVFNCQMGRGRTTTGMVVACMFRTHMEKINIPVVKSEPTIPNPIGQPIISYHKGEYKIILRLVRILESGVENKWHVDMCIDRCSLIQNLRESIEGLKRIADNNSLPLETKDSAKKRGINYLIRYFFLIAFNAFLKQQQSQGFEQKFQVWMKQRTELYSLLDQVTLD